MPTTPHPSDAATIDAILNALYDVLSGPAGQPRDWDRLRSLFLPDARIIPVVSTPGEPARARLLTIEDFIRRLEPIFATENFWSASPAAKRKPTAKSPTYEAPTTLFAAQPPLPSTRAQTAFNFSTTSPAGG